MPTYLLILTRKNITSFLVYPGILTTGEQNRLLSSASFHVNSQWKFTSQRKVWMCLKYMHAHVTKSIIRKKRVGGSEKQGIQIINLILRWFSWWRSSSWYIGYLNVCLVTTPLAVLMDFELLVFLWRWQGKEVRWEETLIYRCILSITWNTFKYPL